MKNQLYSSKSESNSLDKIVEQIIEKLPENFDEETLQQKFQVDDSSECMNTVLIQEISRFNKLLAIIKTSLKDLLSGLKGQTMISDDQEEILESIAKGKLPAQWKKNSYPSLKPLGSYINDLINRLKFFKASRLLKACSLS